MIDYIQQEAFRQDAIRHERSRKARRYAYALVLVSIQIAFVVLVASGHPDFPFEVPW